MLNTEICGCGSGLRSVRCCGADFAAVPNAASLEILSPKSTEAIKLFNEKKYQDAEALALKILDIAPNQRDALRVLFEIRRAENKIGAAEVLARRLAATPADSHAMATAQLQLAQMLLAQGRHRDAEPAAQAAVKLSPRDANIHHVMAVVLTETGQVHAGEKHYRTAMRLLGHDDGVMLANLAWNLKLQGRLDEAADIYEQALVQRPDNQRGIGGFAQVEATRGRLAHAIKLLDQALATWPDDRTLRLLRALADLQGEQFDAVIARLAGPLEELMPPELAARGRAAERLGLITDAGAAFAAAKKMQQERYGLRYEPAVVLQQAEACKAFFTAERMLSLPRAEPCDGPQPVFLLGFARSGTSLLEQMLAKLTGFAAADGLAPVSALVSMATKLAANADEADYPQALANIAVGESQMLPSQLRARYMVNLNNAGIIQTDTKFIIDRAPDNHWHLGLIKLLFPHAPIIHLLRHPLDIMLSNFGQDRRLEENCDVSMATTAQHYDASMQMIRHYRGQLALRYLPVRYEALVANPLETLQSVLEFIGATPIELLSEATLRNNALQPSRVIPAHAAAQQPLHERGVYRYRTYEAALPELFREVRPMLQSWIEALGYGVFI